MNLSALLAAGVVSAGLLVCTASAQITGKVTLEGDPPEPQQINMSANKDCAAAHKEPVFDDSIVVGDKGELANVVVSIKFDEGKAPKTEVPKEPVVLDQKGCMYTPHVVALMVGQKLIVKNADNFFHNVHSMPFDNEPQVNFGQNLDRKGREDIGKTIKVPERFPVKCDIHPWMTAHVNAFDHPFFAVSKDDGTFSIPTKGLKDGKYTIEVWHEKLATEPKEMEVEVKGGKAKVEEIKLDAKAAEEAARADEPGKAAGDVKLASAVTPPPPQRAAKAKDEECCAPSSKAKLLAELALGK